MTLAVYQLTAGFPREELYGLTPNSGVVAPLSLPISPKDADEMEMPNSRRFCSIAMRSASELEYHLLLARNLKLIKPKNHEELAQHAIELNRTLTSLLEKLNADR